MSLTRVVTIVIGVVMFAYAATWRAGVNAQESAALTLEIEDHVAMPIAGKLVGAETPNESALSRTPCFRA